MKVLFVGNPSEKLTDGGSTTFQKSIAPKLAALPDCDYWVPRDPYGRELEHITQTRAIDLIWFLSPYYEAVPVPFVTTVWDLGHRVLPEFPEVSTAPGAWTFQAREQYYRHVLPQAARVCCARHLHPILTQAYGLQPERLRDLPLCVDLEALQATPQTVSEPLPHHLTTGEYLLYPANFWPHKNHVTLLDMLKILRLRRYPLDLVFTGADKGNRAYVEEYAARAGVADQVIFAGFVAPAVLHQLYRHAFALVYASLLGPDNLPPLEAMALGCPVICSEYLGAEQQLGEAVLYFDPLNAQDAARAVVHFMDRPNLRAAKVVRGLERVREHTPQHYVTRVQQVLADVARSRRLWGTGYRHL